jgi:hypothetical protein
MKKIPSHFIEASLMLVGDKRSPYYLPKKLSASAIGHPCDMNLMLSMRGFPEEYPSDQSARRFKLGFEIEQIVLDDMRTAGLRVVDIDRKTGKQFMLTGYEGHAKAYLDGMIMWDDEDPEPLEIKSMNAARFKAVEKNGVKDAEPKYYDQMQFIMGLGGFGSCIFVAYNKDNSLYLARRIDFDPDRWLFLQARIEIILDGGAKKLSSDGSSFICKLCSRNPACQKKEAPPTAELRCSHCVHSSPDVAGSWWCNRHMIHPTGTCPDFQLYSE